MTVHSPGDRVDRYVIETLLGQGGMGRVYRAHDERLDRRVALKILIESADEGSEGRARLVREARAAAALDHANVVQVYDVGESDGVAFIAMELVSGRTLRTLVAEPSLASTEERVRIVSEVARALGAAHDKGLVHRDIKPENVIVRDDGRVKVLDFGIARRSRNATDPSAPTERSLATLTAEGVQVGTPMYMAPEQIRGNPVDGKTDQFAWGVVAYEMFAGAPPWKANDSMALMAAVLTDDPEPLASVPPEVARVVARALSKRPEDRFPSMHALLEALGAGGVTAKREGAAAPVSAPASSAPPRSSTQAAPQGGAVRESAASSRPPRAPSGWPGAPAPAWPMQAPMQVPRLSRRYSPKELEEILDRALRYQPEPADTGYRYEDIASAARDVGVDEPTLQAAMRDLVKRGAVEAPSIDRLRSRSRFFRHAGVQAAIFMFFFLLNTSDNLFGNGREWWFMYPSIVFGFALAVHAAFYFFPAPRESKPIGRRSADPLIEHDARVVAQRIRIAAPPGPLGASVTPSAESRRDWQAEAELLSEEEARSGRVRR